MPVYPSPVPAIFAIFGEPPSERLALLKVLLDEGANPNATDPRLNRHEHILGRAYRASRMDDPNGDWGIDRAVILELLASGANPLSAQGWVEETGEMEPLFPRLAFQALKSQDTTPSPDILSPFSDAPRLVQEMLQACRDQDYRDAEGNDAMVHIVLGLRNFAFKHYIKPLRQCLEMGFPINQPIQNDANAIHYLIRHHAANISQAPWVWEFISEFIDAGIDMQTSNQDGLTCWEAIDGRASSAGHLPAYAAIQANRSAKQLQDTVNCPSAHPRTPRRI